MIAGLTLNAARLIKEPNSYEGASEVSSTTPVELTKYLITLPFFNVSIVCKLTNKVSNINFTYINKAKRNQRV
jgi:hypothetical protein